jgi:hypothetical protein
MKVILCLAFVFFWFREISVCFFYCTIYYGNPHVNDQYFQLFLITGDIQSQRRAKTAQLAQRLGYRLDDRGIGVQFPERGIDFSPFPNFHAESEAHSVYYNMGTRGCFPGSEAAKARS